MKKIFLVLPLIGALLFYNFILLREVKSVIPFFPYKTDLNDSSKAMIEKFIGLIKEVDSTKKGFVLLTNYTCKNEINKLSKIGFLRAKTIIDYCEKKHGVHRHIFHYKDLESLETYPPTLCSQFGLAKTKHSYGILIDVK